jgi:hypothetical protein
VKFQFTEYIYPEELDWVRIVRDSGHAHDVDVEELRELVWTEGGTRELAVQLEVDTDTGTVRVVG